MKTMNCHIGKYLSVSLLGFALSAQAALVYDNTTTYLGSGFNPGSVSATQSREIGDQIILAGTERLLTSFSLEYYGQSLGAGEMLVRFYENDGPDFAGFATPGTIRYDSGFFAIPSTDPDRNTVMFSAVDFASGVVPLVGEMPDTFTWSVVFRADYAGGAETLLSLYTPPTVGNNFTDFWDRQLDTTWILRKPDELDPLAPEAFDFGARVLAVPEPAVVHLLLGGLIGLGAMRFSRRNKA